MERVSISFLFVLLATMASAQNISNVDFHQAGDEIVITYDLDESSHIVAYVSLDGGKSYKEMHSIQGDVGKTVLPGKKRIVWKILGDIPEGLAGQVQFKVSTNLFVPLDNDEIEMVYVKGGTFMMGATSEQGDDVYIDEKPVHQVTLSDYYIGKYEVTQGLWEKVMGTTVEQQRDKEVDSIVEWSKEMGEMTVEEYCEEMGMTMKQLRDESSLYGIAPNYPMYWVSWDEVWEFCRKLTQLTGKKYALPTEAQWEYAARGGEKSKGCKYSGSNDIDKVAWCSDNSGKKIHLVGSKQPNELGIYDMSGNVLEWCQDKYHAYNTQNSAGISSDSGRILRGGSWHSRAGGCRVSIRYCYTSSIRDFNLGSRVVCLP